jgi:hypothetical protein
MKREPLLPRLCVPASDCSLRPRDPPRKAYTIVTTRTASPLQRLHLPPIRRRSADVSRCPTCCWSRTKPAALTDQEPATENVECDPTGLVRAAHTFFKRNAQSIATFAVNRHVTTGGMIPRWNDIHSYGWMKTTCAGCAAEPRRFPPRPQRAQISRMQGVLALSRRMIARSASFIRSCRVQIGNSAT